MAAAMTSCSRAILGIERLTSAFARKVYEQMVALMQCTVEAWNFTIKTFKTCQFMESTLFCSEENARNMHVSCMML